MLKCYFKKNFFLSLVWLSSVSAPACRLGLVGASGTALLAGLGPPVAEPGSGHAAAVVPVYRLRDTGSAVELHGLSCSVWDLPVSGTEPMSPALAGRFFTTEPSGKPSNISFFKSKLPTSSPSLF